MFSFAAFLHPFRTCRQTATGTLLPATPVEDPTLGRRRVVMILVATKIKAKPIDRDFFHKNFQKLSSEMRKIFQLTT